MTSPNSPLTEDHYQQIRNALDIISQAEAQIALAKRAGIDTSDAEKRLADSKAQLQQIKSVYFPGR